MGKNDKPVVYLVEYSQKDHIWDDHKFKTTAVSDIYGSSKEFVRYSERMDDCSQYLFFGWNAQKDTGELQLRLRNASFCRVRHCPVCQWRRSLMWRARFYNSIPGILSAYPKSRWIFLTLTVRNCEVNSLGDTLTHINAAFKKLEKRREFKPVLGWVRTTEITRGEGGSAHPHCHCLLMVTPSWFSHNYVKHERWVELWRDCLKVNYEPNVDIRTVKDKVGSETLHSAVMEVLKYSVKPDDMLADPEWFMEMSRQTHKRRFIAAGGALKKSLKVTEESNAELIKGDDNGEGEDVGSNLAFGWESDAKKYRRMREKEVKRSS